jgi:hypothetical protein
VNCGSLVIWRFVVFGGLGAEVGDDALRDL